MLLGVSSDPVNGAAQTLAHELTGWIVTYALPPFVMLVAVGIMISVMMWATKKAMRAADFIDGDGSPEPWSDEDYYGAESAGW